MKRIVQSPLLNVLCFSIFWAAEIFITKLAFVAGAPLVQFTLQSFIVTFVLLSFYVLPKRFHALKKIPTNILTWLLVANAILLGIGGFLGNAGIQLTTAVNAGFLTQFGTVTTILFAWILLKEKITITKLLTIFVIMLGTFLLITKGQLIIPHSGDLLLLLACICWGLGAVMVKKSLSTTKIHPDIVSFLRPAAGIPILLFFIMLMPFYPPVLQKAFQFNLLDLRHIEYIFFNAVFLTGTWLFANRTLRFASASYTVMMSSITPILVALLAIIFLSERIDRIQLIGIFLIIASSFFTQYTKVEKH